MGQGLSATPIRTCRGPIHSVVRADLSLGLCLLRRPGLGPDWQPRHLAARRRSRGIYSQIGLDSFFEMPMVFWLNANDFTIQAVCWAGAAFSLLVLFNLLPRLSLFFCYLLYLSLLYAGNVFMSYQWDTFLLEGGVLTLLLNFTTRPGIWLLRWLLFRFMFMSGVVKLLSGDPNWWNLSALHYHFLTQPLPTPACLVCRASAGAGADLRHRRHFRRRAGSAVPDLLSPAAAIFRRLRDPVAGKPDPGHRQLQLVQSPDHAAVSAAVR